MLLQFTILLQSHLEHVNGFSPVWVLSCTFKLPLWLKAFLTGKWFLSCVGPFMLIQMSTFLKSLITLGPGRWLCSCVGPFMNLQIRTDYCKQCDKKFSISFPYNLTVKISARSDKRLPRYSVFAQNLTNKIWP